MTENIFWIKLFYLFNFGITDYLVGKHSTGLIFGEIYYPVYNFNNVFLHFYKLKYNLLS